uniref:Uncharacterized protein n=1 Tax=Arcella intermedia TaxID=1963864 RepID=A0A6B2LJC0_9EUKA
MMYAEEWDGKQDPAGWCMTEDLDGFRAFWDGTHLYSKNGNIFPIPLEFTEGLPRDVCLDGILWVGSSALHKLSSICRKTSRLLHDNYQNAIDLWRNVNFSVYDAPMVDGYYLDRYSFAKNSISKCQSNIQMIPTECCLGWNHLQTKLHQIKHHSGKGMILYHPSSLYTPGRTTNILKVNTDRAENN